MRSSEYPRGNFRPTGVEEVDVLSPTSGGITRAGGPTLALMRLGDTPIGQILLPEAAPARIGEGAARGLTREHAEQALRASVLEWIRQSPGRRPFRLEDALAAAAEAVDDSHVETAPDEPCLSVAVCTRDRPVELDRALRAIAPALRPTDELLVVLSAPDDDRVPFDREQFPQVRLIVERRPGLAWARNRALAEFRSSVILFTDDDCLPDTRWVEAFRSMFFRNPDVDIATGLVEPLELTTRAQVLFERYGGFSRGYLRRWIHAPRRRCVSGDVGNVGTFGTGANLALRRRLLERIGPFDAALGAGTSTNGGEDLEFLFRALKAGALLAYEPRARVRHGHRRELAQLDAQIESWGSGFAAALERTILAFPEERDTYRFLSARIALLHHLRRALFNPTLRRLAIAELRGLLGANRRYAPSRSTAEDIAVRIPSPAKDASPFAHVGVGANRARHEKRVQQVIVDLDSLRRPLDVGSDVDEVSVAIRLEGQQLLTVVLPVFNGSIGMDRLLDATLDLCGGALAGRSWTTAVRECHSFLVGCMRESSRSVRTSQ